MKDRTEAAADAGEPAVTDLARLLALVARLRAPDGCPWDREQELRDLRAYLLEEAHEAAAAVDEGDWQSIAEELGDLLFQIAFILRLGEEAGALDAGTALTSVHRKMVDRHPHVFGDASATDADQVRRDWERRKLAAAPAGSSLLAGMAPSLPALLAAYRTTQKAAGVGFDWSSPGEVLAKVREELDELEGALQDGPKTASEGGGGQAAARRRAVEEEIGDLLLSVANLARKLDVDPEAALAGANAKFRRRFSFIEGQLADRGRSLAEAGREEMEALWQRAKEQEPEA